jgi:hypothetical protein
MGLRRTFDYQEERLMKNHEVKCRICGAIFAVHETHFLAQVGAKESVCFPCRRIEDEKITYYIKVPGGYTSVRI